MSKTDASDEAPIQFEVAEDESGARVDQLIGDRIAEISRSAAARLIRDGRVTIEGIAADKPSIRVETGQIVTVRLLAPEPARAAPENIPLSVLYQDDDIAIIDKPSGLVVHPAAGHQQGTLVNALLHHLDGLSGIGGEMRPGIVHRLDKDTSGLVVVAKNDLAHRFLSETWNRGSVRKTYLAIVYGAPSPDSGMIDAPIGRHARDRKRMAIVPDGKLSSTAYRVLEFFTGCSLVELDLNTGRTHQIRVHLQSIGHPVVGDPIYSGAQWKGIQDRAVRDVLRSMKRQALHAFRLELVHPSTRERLRFEAELPEDMRRMLEGLAALAGWAR